MTHRLLTLVALLLAPAAAWAQADGASQASPPVEVPAVTSEVRRFVGEGDLAQANAVLDRAFRADSLTREELAELTALRALLAYADDRLGLLEESLAGLAALTPPGWMLDDFPPPVRARLEEVRRELDPIRLEVEVATEVVDGQRVGRLVPAVESDAGRLVREVRVRAAVGAGPLRLLSPEEALSLGDPHREVLVRYALEGVGIGGATVATRGTADDALTLEVPALPTDDTFLHVAIVTLASVLVAGAAAFAFAWVLTDELTVGQPTTVRCCGP